MELTLIQAMDMAAALQQFQDALRSAGTDSAPLSAQAQALALLPDTEFEDALEAFNLAANAPTYYATSYDCDFGALLLEALADACGDVRRKGRLYVEAKMRAEIFASFATSGGEGLARSGEVERIARKVEDLEAQVSGSPFDRTM